MSRGVSVGVTVPEVVAGESLFGTVIRAVGAEGVLSWGIVLPARWPNVGGPPVWPWLIASSPAGIAVVGVAWAVVAFLAVGRRSSTTPLAAGEQQLGPGGRTVSCPRCACRGMHG